MSIVVPTGGSVLSVYLTAFWLHSAFGEPVSVTHTTLPYVPCVKPPVPVSKAQFSGRMLMSLASTFTVTIEPTVPQMSSQSAAQTGDAIVIATVHVDVQPNVSVTVYVNVSD